MLCHACYAEPDAIADCTACRGTGRATRMPLCEEAWSEVVPGLWQGGHDVRSQAGTAGVVGAEFDLVVSLAVREGSGPADGVEHVVLRMADAGVDAALAARVDALAAQVVAALADGRRVLVRCYGGLNRSGLVVAAALVRQGRTPDEAIGLVRAARGPWALTNPGFVAHLRTLGPGGLALG